MFNINIPIDDYIDKTFKIQEEDVIVLPKRKKDNKSIYLSISLDDSKDIDDNILYALSDGFINGYIECCKDLTKTLLRLNYSYEDIHEITNLKLESIYKIENEL